LSEKLNIFIPSYNRHLKCFKLVKTLIIQKKNIKNVIINVLDNCSDTIYEDYFKEQAITEKEIKKGTLKIFRNKVNIGMSANITRCFEASSSLEGWLWIISDDDLLDNSAIKKVLDSISDSNINSGFIKFSSKTFLHENKFIIDNPKDLISHIKENPRVRFNSYIFLTNMIYKINNFKDAVNIAYDHGISHVPHLFILILSLSSKNYILHCNKKIVDYVKPDIGYSYGLFAGLQIGAIQAINIPNISLRDFHNIFQVHNDYKIAIDLYFELKSKNSLNNYSTLLFIHLLNLFFSKCYLRCIGFSMFTLLILNPFIRKIVIYTLLKTSVKNHILEMKLRYK